MTPLQTVQDFLSHKRIAFVGLSTKDKDFSRAVYQEMVDKGFDVVPVNPGADLIAGQRCYPRLQDIEPSVQAALLMVPSELGLTILRDAQEAGIRRIWFHRGGGPGAVSEEAVAFCDEHGMLHVDGQCPLMFLDDAGLIHKLHGLGKKLVGTYPEA